MEDGCKSIGLWPCYQTYLYIYSETLTSVLREHSVVMLMLNVLTPMAHIPAPVSLDIMEMGRIAKVRIVFVLFCFVFVFFIHDPC